LIPEISKTQNSFDILEAAIELLAPDMLLVVLENLMLHEFLLVRKKVIELLNRKLEESYFDAVEEKKLLKIVVPLKKICETVRDEANTALEIVQQYGRRWHNWCQRVS
jgi:predicted nuclease with TOPRIM domain